MRKTVYLCTANHLKTRKKNEQFEQKGTHCMARRRAPRRHDNGNRRTLHRPVLHIPGSRKTARIQELGSHLRLAAPPVRTAFRDDDRSAAAPRRRHEHKGLLQEAHPAHTMAHADMSVLYNIFPWFTGVIGLPKEIIGDFFCYVQGNESQALADSLRSVAMIPLQFSFTENHMWYMYLLIGMYLYIPFFSAWIEKYGRSAERLFLTIWAVSLFLPYGEAYISKYLFGEATWNEFGLFYYFAGFSGYLLLGHYLRRGNDWSLGKTLAVSAVMFAAGYAVTFTGFSAAAANPASTELDMELYFTFCSPNVVLMTIAVFLLLQKVKINGARMRKALATMPKYGFGIYIVHYFVVGPVFLLIGEMSLPIPLQVPVMAIMIFMISYAFTWAMYRLLGRKARYIMG